MLGNGSEYYTEIEVASVTTDEQRERIWGEMLDAETRSLYFAGLERRYQVHEQKVTLLILLLSSGSVVSLLADIPADYHLLRAALPAITAALSGFLLLEKHSSKARTCSYLHARLEKLAADYEDLWSTLDDPAALREWKRLQAVGRDLSETATKLPSKVRQLRKWQSFVLRRRNLAPAAT